MRIIYRTQNTPIHGWGCFVTFKSRRKDPDPLSALFAAPIRVKSGDLLKPPPDPAARLRGPRRPFTLFRRGSFSRFPLSRSRLLVTTPGMGRERERKKAGERARRYRRHSVVPTPGEGAADFRTPPLPADSSPPRRPSPIEQTRRTGRRPSRLVSPGMAGLFSAYEEGLHRPLAPNSLTKPAFSCRTTSRGTGQ